MTPGVPVRPGAAMFHGATVPCDATPLAIPVQQETMRLHEAPLIDLLTVASLFLVAVLGTIIAYQAYRGYRRNDSRPMLWLAVGLFLLTFVPFVLNVAITTLVSPDQAVTEFAENLSRLLGLLVIMYSLYGRR